MLLSVSQDLTFMSILHVGLHLSGTLFSVVNALVQTACPVVYIKVGIHTIFFKHASRSVEAGATAAYLVSREALLLNRVALVREVQC